MVVSGIQEVRCFWALSLFGASTRMIKPPAKVKFEAKVKSEVQARRLNYYEKTFPHLKIEGFGMRVRTNRGG